jgi:hypothetical protein
MVGSLADPVGGSVNLKVDYSDFSLGHIVCEIRYPGAYLLFDRTGSIWHALKLRFPSLTVVMATPQQTSFRTAVPLFSRLF